MRRILLLLMLTNPAFVFSQTADTIQLIIPDSSFYAGERIFIEEISPKEIKKERVRLTAAILCITLGPFGAHRLYLGTSTSVPVFYTLTLGGGLGILPVVDLCLIAFSKDLEKYKNNPNVFMWSEK